MISKSVSHWHKCKPLISKKYTIDLVKCLSLFARTTRYKLYRSQNYTKKYRDVKLWSIPNSLFSLLSIRIPYVPLKFKSVDPKIAEFVSHATFLKSDFGPCVTIEYPLWRDLHFGTYKMYPAFIRDLYDKAIWSRMTMKYTVCEIQYVTYCMLLKMKSVAINKSRNLSKTIWQHQKRTIGFGLDLNRYWNTWSVVFQVYKHILLLWGPNSISPSNMKLPKTTYLVCIQ